MCEHKSASALPFCFPFNYSPYYKQTFPYKNLFLRRYGRLHVSRESQFVQGLFLKHCLKPPVAQNARLPRLTSMQSKTWKLPPQQGYSHLGTKPEPPETLIYTETDPIQCLKIVFFWKVIFFFWHITYFIIKSVLFIAVRAPNNPP